MQLYHPHTILGLGQTQTAVPQGGMTPVQLDAAAAGMALAVSQGGLTTSDLAAQLTAWSFNDRHTVAEDMISHGANQAFVTTAVEQADRQMGDAPPITAAWEWTKNGGWVYLAAGAAGIFILTRVL